MGKNSRLDANISSLNETFPDDQHPRVGQLPVKPDSPGCYLAALTAALGRCGVPTGEGDTVEKALKGS